jgi:biotin carboxylase
MKNNLTALVIGTGAFQQKGLDYLKANGFKIIGVDGNPNASGKETCDNFYHCDLNEYEKIVTIAKEENAAFAVGFECDPAVEPVNIVNKALGLKALNEDARKASMDKLMVRHIQKKLGLNCPEFYEIYSLEELKKIHSASDHNWVLKPIASSGSRGVELLSRSSNLEEAYARSSKAKKPTEPLLLEEFIQGKEIALDGFCVNGECHALTISHKDRSEPPYLLDIGLLISSDVQSELALEAKRQLGVIFRDLQTDLSSAYHAEFLYNEKGVHLVEFSFRGAGFNVFSKLIPQVTGVDTLKFLVEQSQGLDLKWNATNPSHNALYLGFFDGKDGVLKNVVVPEQIQNAPSTLELNIYAKPGQTTNFLRSGADRLGHIILIGSVNDSLKDSFFNIKKQVQFIYEN